MDPFTVLAVGTELFTTAYAVVKGASMIVSGVHIADEVVIRQLPAPLQGPVRNGESLYDKTFSFPMAFYKEVGLASLVAEIERDEFGDELGYLYVSWTARELVEADQQLALLQQAEGGAHREVRKARGILKALVKTGQARFVETSNQLDNAGWAALS
ncbi:MAG: hypothetical protein KDB07_07340 [Planctomycetes bacterium]|nr:hypothetical protein [Planctomycetota bacterium]